MSKASELRILQGARSIDAPRRFSHRTGDSEGDGGSMLDAYIQVEESYFEDEEEAAKAAFLKGFQGYLEKVFEGTERKFLRRLIAGKGKPHEIGRALGVDWFECLQSIQRKAFENVEPLERLAALTGWSRAEEFTTSILRKVSKYAGGASDYAQANRNKLRESLKAEGGKRQAEWKNNKQAAKSAYRAANREKFLQCAAAYRAAHREEKSAYNRAYKVLNRDKINERRRELYAKNKEKILAKRQTAEKKARHAEYMKAYNKANAEKDKEYRKARLAAMKAADTEEAKKWLERRREQRKAATAKYTAAHREEINARMRAKRAAEKAAKAASATSESCAAT